MLKVAVDSEAQTVPATPLIGNDKIGVLLLNLGGPETLDDVQPFLFNLFADPVTFYLRFYILLTKSLGLGIQMSYRFW